MTARSLPADSVLKCEQITTLPQELLSHEPLGRPLAPQLLEDVERGVVRAIGVAVS